jgi:hypothetical protein
VTTWTKSFFTGIKSFTTVQNLSITNLTGFPWLFFVPKCYKQSRKDKYDDD